MTDAELLEAIGTRDQAAMSALYDRYGRLVFAIAMKVLRDPDAAEDVMQDVLMQIWRMPGGFVAQKGSLGSWLAVVARNRAIDVIRRRSRLDSLEDLVIVEPRSMGRSVEDEHLMSQVRSVVMTLPMEQQTSLQMAYFEGLSHSEIAERTATPLGTVKTRIRAAVLSLRKALEA